MEIMKDKSIFRFILVGGINTILGAVIMFGLYNLFGVSYWASSLISYIIGSIFSFGLNKRFTFEYKKRDIQSVLKYAITILFCYGVAYGLAKVAIVSALYYLKTEIQDNIALFLGMCIYTFMNYLGQRFFAFSKKNNLKLLLGFAIDIFFVGIIMLYFFKQYGAYYGYWDSIEHSSYCQNLNLLIRQLKGEVSLTTIYGNMHGAFYPICLAYLSRYFYLSEPQISYFLIGGVFVSIALVINAIMWRVFYKNHVSIIISGFLISFLIDKTFFPPITYSYWAAPVILLIVTPLLFWYMMNIKDYEFVHGKQGILLYLLIVFFMGSGNVIRQHSALPILMCLFGICAFMFFFLKKSKLISVVELIIANIIFFGLEPLLHKFYNLVSGKLQIENVERPWHAIWCGLGYIENEYGFMWDDGAAASYVQSVNPKVGYCTEPYFDILRDRVISVFLTDPMYIVKVYTIKFYESIKVGLSNYTIILIVATIILLLIKIISKQVMNQKDVVITCISLCWIVFGNSQGVIGMPVKAYILSSYAGYITIIIFSVLELYNLILDFIKNKKKGDCLEQ